MLKKMICFAAIVGLVFALAGAAAQAATIAVTEDQTTPTTPYPSASADDLANSGKPSFESLDTTYPTDWNGGSYTRLNDAQFGGGGYNPGWASAYHGDTSGEAVQTFTFDTTTNIYGYDITSIVSSSLDRDERTWQRYTLAYNTVGDDTWTDVIIPGENGYTVDSPGNTSGTGTDYSWRQVTISDLGLTHVDQIRFTTPIASTGTKGATSWAEIDVFGSASPIPEPSAFVLAALGLLSLGFVTWRRRKR